jgi:cytochrome b561
VHWWVALLVLVVLLAYVLVLSLARMAGRDELPFRREIEMRRLERRFAARKRRR